MTQYLIEEAAFLAVALEDAQTGTVDSLAPADPAYADALARARHFASTGTVM